MSLLTVTARLALFWVFALAAVAKLTDLRGSREAVVAFGVPAALAGIAAWVIPMTELSVAVLLLIGHSAWWSAVVALALLGVFSAGIAMNLSRGHAPACNCFGGYSTRPISRGNLVRNAAFAALALLVVAPGPAYVQPDTIQWVSGAFGVRPAGVIALGLMAMLLAGQAIFLVQLFMQHGRLLLRLDALGGRMAQPEPPGMPNGPPLVAGEPAPSFALPTLEGGAASSESLREAGHPILLIFAETTCPACALMLPDVGRWQTDFAGSVTVAVVTSAGDRGMRRAARRHRLRGVLLQSGHETAEAFRVGATPAGIAIAADGRIASAPALGREAISQLLRQTSEGLRPSGVAPGSDNLRLITQPADARRTRGSAS